MSFIVKSTPKSVSKLASMLGLTRMQTIRGSNPCSTGPSINSLQIWGSLPRSMPRKQKPPTVASQPKPPVMPAKTKVAKSVKPTQTKLFYNSPKKYQKFSSFNVPHLRNHPEDQQHQNQLLNQCDKTKHKDVVSTLKELDKHGVPMHNTYYSLLRCLYEKMNENYVEKRRIRSTDAVAEQGGHGKRMQYLREAGRCRDYTDTVARRKAEIAVNYQKYIEALRLRNQLENSRIETYKRIRDIRWKHKKELHQSFLCFRRELGKNRARNMQLAVNTYLKLKHLQASKTVVPTDIGIDDNTLTNNSAFYWPTAPVKPLRLKRAKAIDALGDDNPTALSSDDYNTLEHLNSLAAQPVFDFGMPRNITARAGQTAAINCRVEHLGDKSVSWIRKRDLHILTAGILTYTSDERFKVIRTEDSKDWSLQVKYAQPRDSGIYECQVNTEPKISMAFRLNVIVTPADSKAIISGPADLYVKVGSAITLTCHVKQPSSQDIGPIHWYRGPYIITPFVVHPNDAAIDLSRRISMESQLGDILKSRLRIANAQTADSGNYTCLPTTAEGASVMVHVINDENPAAMQKSNASGGRLHGSVKMTSITLANVMCFIKMARLLLPS